MPEPIREAMMNLAAELGIDLSGLADDVLEMAALRIRAEDILPTKPNIERVLADLSPSRAGEAVEKSADAPVSPARSKMHYLATEATDAKYRHRLSLVHNAEDRRTSLDIHPRRPDPLGPTVAHPACIAAKEEGASVCARCSPILHGWDCTCPSCDYAWGVQE